MAKGFTIEAKGLRQLKKKFSHMPKAVAKEVDGILHVSANEFANRAAQDAPVDQSLLRQGISAKKKGVMDYDVVSSAPYSAYIEFGTKKRVKIPADLTAIAAQAQGKGKGDYYDFLNSILDWVKRKGITARYSVKTRRRLKSTKADDERLLEAAQAIANSIIRHGIHAQPYFFKQREPVAKSMEQRLEPALKKALSK